MLLLPFHIPKDPNLQKTSEEVKSSVVKLRNSLHFLAKKFPLPRVHLHNAFCLTIWTDSVRHGCLAT